MRRRQWLFQRKPAKSYLPQKKPVTKKIIPIILTAIPFLLLFIFFNSPVLRIKELSCSLDGMACTNEQLELLNKYQRKNFLFLKPSKISREFLDADLSLQAAQIKLTFPNKLNAALISDSKIITLGILKADLPKLEVEEASPSSETAKPHPLVTQFNLINTDSFTPTGLTSAGHLVDPQSDKTNLFILTDPSTIDQSSRVNLFNYFEELDKSGLTFIKAIFIDPFLITQFKNDRYVIFDLNLPPRGVITTLQQINAEATMGYERAIIDMRWNKPVISTY